MEYGEDGETCGGIERGPRLRVGFRAGSTCRCPELYGVPGVPSHQHRAQYSEDEYLHRPESLPTAARGYDARADSSGVTSTADMPGMITAAQHELCADTLHSFAALRDYGSGGGVQRLPSVVHPHGRLSRCGGWPANVRHFGALKGGVGDGDCESA
jgi:hypothetical protein